MSLDSRLEINKEEDLVHALDGEKHRTEAHKVAVLAFSKSEEVPKNRWSSIYFKYSMNSQAVARKSIKSA